MIKFPLLFLLLFTTIAASSQNVGVNTTNPKVSLDVQGGFATRAVTIAPAAGNAVNIPANASLVVISGGSATATINGLYPSAYNDGQRMIIYNTNAAGFDVLFFGASIPLNQAREFICRNPGGWSLLSGALSTEGWGLKGNAGTDTAVNFIGTTDNMPLKFKVNNVDAGVIGFGSFANVSLGMLSLTNTKLSQGNTAIGSLALNSSKGNYSTAIGSYALYNDTAGSRNVAIGFQSMVNRFTGTLNTAVGNASLGFNNGNANVAVGLNAMAYDERGSYNVSIGSESLTGSKSSNGAVVIGYKAAYSDSAADGMVAIGRAALYNNNGHSGNVAIGDSTLYNNAKNNVPLNLNLAHHNTAVGNKALFENMEGSGNTGIGYQALRNNKNAYGNTGVGHLALFTDSSGVYNTAIGWDAMYAMKSGNNNTAIGRGALYNNNAGNNNIAVGALCMENATGDFNIAIGNGALSNNTNNANIALGTNALINNINGSNNVAIGINALQNATGGYNIALGIGAGANEPGSNKLYIENTTADKNNALIYGDFAADSLLLNAKTVVRNNAVVKGFTKLGGYDAEVPSIKMKKINIPAGPAVNAFVSYPLGSGITDAKVVGIQVLLNYAGTWKMPPGYIDVAGYEYNVQIQNNNIIIVLKNGNSANIGGKPISVIVTYEE